MIPAKISEIVDSARAAGRGVGAFNVIAIEHAEAIVAGAGHLDHATRTDLVHLAAELGHTL